MRYAREVSWQQRFGRVSALVLILLPPFGTSASAQPLGTFRWQQSPYCNVVTVNAVHSGGVYQLDGIDDQCGAPTQAAVVGIAFLNPDGTLGLGLTLVTSPGGIPVHIDAAISVASGHGTWRDSAGAAGDFVLTAGAGTGGSARPVPRVSFAGGLSGGGATIINVAPPVADTDAATKGYVDGAAANVRAALLNEKVLKASVNADGTRSGTGPFTASTFGTGSYSVTFDVTGMGLSLQFGVAAATPLVLPGRFRGDHQQDHAVHRRHAHPFGHGAVDHRRGGVTRRLRLRSAGDDAGCRPAGIGRVPARLRRRAGRGLLHRGRRDDVRRSPGALTAGSATGASGFHPPPPKSVCRPCNLLGALCGFNTRRRESQLTHRTKNPKKTSIIGHEGRTNASARQLLQGGRGAALCSSSR